MTIGGPMLLASGCAIAGVGIAGLVSTANEEDDVFTTGATALAAIITAIGSAGVITGILLTAIGASNMQKI